jgi:predicted membrane-bound spermidine synthase
MRNVIAFVSGAVLMGLEIVGSRILAPTFGNSIFVWGSLISVFLAALSAGYYAGGLIADRRPDAFLLRPILLVAGGAVLLLPVLYPAVNGVLFDHHLGPRLGPLLASTLLFPVPAAALGTVPPYLVRLRVEQVSRAGRAAGTVYALSTAGSIAGTLLTAFVLIPSMGLRAILFGMGGVLIVLGAATGGRFRDRKSFEPSDRRKS